VRWYYVVAALAAVGVGAAAYLQPDLLTQLIARFAQP
jgi:hypothetical protein